MMEVEMSSTARPADPNRPQSDAERAMSANARSRDGQGKAEDRARANSNSRAIRPAKSPEPGLGGVSSLRPQEARSAGVDRQDAEADERAEGEGMAKPKDNSGDPDSP
jgi:hypothetical protein